MDFIFDSRRDIAVFLERRFPRTQDRIALAKDARIPPVDPTWDGLLQEAARLGRLHRLLAAASRARPADENLRAMATLFAQEQRAAALRRAMIIGPVAGLAVAATALLLLLPGSGHDASPPAVAATVTSTAPPAPRAAPAPAPTVAPSAEAPAPAAAPPEPAPPSPTPAPAQVVAADPGRPPGRCRSSSDIVGYWYAGRTSPGAQGSVITMENAVRVRVDYPDTHNDFNARAPITCHLAPGDRVRLTAAPIHVPGDAWWVPLTDGDLLVDPPLAASDTGAPE